MKLSQLIHRMVQITSNKPCTKWAKCDLLSDIIRITSDVESIESWPIYDEYKRALWIWCISENHSMVSDCADSIEAYMEEINDTIFHLYKIRYAGGAFTIELIANLEMLK